MNPEIRVCFAPSPTGYLHVGGARTALFNWLFTRHHGGKFVLRIEETDRTRNIEEAMAAICDGLQWLGLNWDEGPHIGGDFGPYLQSERAELYESYLKKLEDGGHIFEDQGALRFRSPREHVFVDDLVCGKIDFDLSNEQTHPDMTIRRSDGSWIFHFVNVIDDMEMKISHVIRGEYARELSDSEFYALALTKLKSSGVKIDNYPKEYVRAALQTCKGKINMFDELLAYCGFYFTDDFDYNPEGVAKHFTAEIKPRLKAVRDAFSALQRFDAAEIETTLKITAADLGVKVGAIVHPTRLAVSGSNIGPSLYHLLEVLGKEKVLARIDRALSKFF